MRFFLTFVTVLTLLMLVHNPASSQSRVEAVSTISDQVMIMMSLCGAEPSDSTKRDIANRFNDETFDLDHAKVLVLAAMAASSRAASDDNGVQQACKKWHEVFVYTGAIAGSASLANSKANTYQAPPKTILPPHAVGKIGDTVFVNIGALRCRTLDQLKAFQKFFHEDNIKAMDDAADRCLPDETAKTPEEEATGQRVAVLEKRDEPSKAQCVKEAGAQSCVWVMGITVEIEEDRR